MKNKIAAKSLGSFIPQITRKAYETYGFSTLQLVANWSAIVGPELASSTRPEKLKWPHGSPAYLEDESNNYSNRQQRNGATLILRVEGPRSLEVQFGAGQIIERINTFFGYCAVTDLRILQAPIDRKKVEINKPRLADPKDLAQKLSNIKDDDLKAALYRMAQGVKATQLKKEL